MSFSLSKNASAASPTRLLSLCTSLLLSRRAQIKTEWISCQMSLSMKTRVSFTSKKPYLSLDEDAAGYQKYDNTKDELSSPRISQHDPEKVQILDNDGLASPGEIIRHQDIYFQKECPIDPKGSGNTQYRTSKQSYKGAEGETAVVDRVALCSDKHNNLSVKFMIRHTRRPEVGDKFSSRHGQKGVEDYE